MFLPNSATMAQFLHRLSFVTVTSSLLRRPSWLPSQLAFSSAALKNLDWGWFQSKLEAETSSDDQLQALEELHLLSAKGFTEAHVLLGQAYEMGQGVDVDTAMALRLFAAASAQGSGKAKFLLGCLFMENEVTSGYVQH
jgi:TPR repeat protein